MRADDPYLREAHERSRINRRTRTLGKLRGKQPMLRRASKVFLPLYRREWTAAREREFIEHWREVQIKTSPRGIIGRLLLGG